MLSNYTNLSFPVCSLAISILLFILFFYKDKVENAETKIYSKLVITSLIESSLFTFNSLIAHFWYNENTYFIFEILNKILYGIYIVWFSLLFYYMFSLIVNAANRDKVMAICNLTVKVADFIIIFIMCLLKVDTYYNPDTGFSNSYGPAANVLFFGIAVYLIMMIIIAFMSIRKENRKKFLPLYILIALMVVALAIRVLDPFLAIYSNVLSFTLLVMFFTIENPDVQMMSEISKNRKLIEKSNEDTSNFLFRMTQDIKKPVKDIIAVSNEMVTIKNSEELKEGTKIINNKAKELDYLINDALDVSSMNTKNIKIYKTRYNVINLFKELKYQTESKINDKVKFEYYISGSIPEYLYGDSIKLKQSVYAVLENAVKNTKEGFISLDIDAIVKYDIVRIIINISDSGKGMGIDEVNNILSLNIDDLSKIDLSKEKETLNLKEVKKLVTYLGGNLIVKSDEGKGTSVSITINQKIVPTKETEISKKLELFEESLHNNKNILVADGDAKELSKITSYIEGLSKNVSGFLFGRDIIDKISSRHKYDLIILNDEIDGSSAYELLKELKKIENFNTPVVIMIEDSKEFIKLHYLQDGFSDVIMKSKLTSELERIMKRF